MVLRQVTITQFLYHLQGVIILLVQLNIKPLQKKISYYYYYYYYYYYQHHDYTRDLFRNCQFMQIVILK